MLCIIDTDKVGVNFEGVKMLKDMGADLNKKDTIGRTALHLMASFETIGDILTEFLELYIDEIDINEKTNGGVTPLMFAVKNNNQNAVKILL